MEEWIINYDKWNLSEELLRETLCTLGNGHFASRGSAEDAQKSEYHYPGTYLAGGYNRLVTEISNETLVNEDLVNWPNWLPLTFTCDGSNWFNINEIKIEDFFQELDLKSGELRRRILFKDSGNRYFVLQTQRMISMDNSSVGAMTWTLKSLNWSGHMKVRSVIWTGMKNEGVKRYRELKNEHISIVTKKIIYRNIFLVEAKTNQSQIMMSQAIRTNFFVDGRPCSHIGRIYESDLEFGQIFDLKLNQGENLKIEKILSLFTTKDNAISSPGEASIKLIDRLPNYQQLFERHVKQWSRLWSLCDIDLPENPKETKLLRLHIFHILQTCSFKTIDQDVGIPARGLHGEAYRGHIFWDEVFILPFFFLRVPEIARSLLMYRYRRLEEARCNAKMLGFFGAMFPWQSGSTGEEVGQKMHLNPKSGRWLTDDTSKQRHINGVIVYNVWKYYQSTKDHEFLSFFGVELVLEIAHFWSSHMTFNPSRIRYDINGVVGPDEFHTRYPGSVIPGINNNAFTNFMASWSIKTAIELYDKLAVDRKAEILSILSLTELDLKEWEMKAQKIFLPISDDLVIEQFEGFEKLKNLDFVFYKHKYGNIQRIDRILEAEGDSVNNYKVNKQSDVLMLYYLFSTEELADTFAWMNYTFEVKSISRNIQYHLQFSTHGSTLSRIVHAWVISKFDIEQAWGLFKQALESDVADIQGGTTQEGIHLGAMAGTIDLVQRCFVGLEVKNDILWISPILPKELKRLNFKIRFRGHVLIFKLTQDHMIIKIERCWIAGAKIGHKDQIYNFKQGDEFCFDITKI
jgi:trehalose/maltose hydrolase-like predicted phosphorylase